MKILRWFLTAFFAAQLSYSAWVTGQTTDETYYSGSGFPMLYQADYRFMGEHPPLATQLGAAPLPLIKASFPYENPVLLPDGGVDLSRTGARFLYESQNNPQRILFLERLPVALLTLLLAIALTAWTQKLFGPGGALFSLFLLCVCPNLLGHGSLYTTDAALAAFFFMAVWRLDTFFEKPSWKNALVAGLLAGCAMMSKIGGVLLIPVFGLFFLAATQGSRREEYFAGFLIAACASLAVIVFGFTDFPEMIMKGKPLSHFMQVFRASAAHAQRYHAYCIGGSPVACDWRYFPALILFKTPVFSLVSAAAGIAVLLLSEKKRKAVIVLFPPLLFLFTACFINRVHVGLRHVLPVYPFLYLAAGAIIPAVFKIRSTAVRKAVFVCLFTAAGWTLVRHVSEAPHFLSYFNEFVGGPEQGASLTMDSNIDWGQDNRRLVEKMLELDNPGVRIFSRSENAAEYDYYNLKWARAQQSEFKDPVRGYYAVDIVTYADQSREPASWLYKRRPDFRAGRAIYIFKVQ